MINLDILNFLIVSNREFIFLIMSLKYIQSEKTNSDFTVVLLHGYGANANDLYPVHSFFHELKNLSWIFPEGPLLLEEYFGMDARAWFPLGVADKIQKAISTGDWSLISNYIPDGLDQARRELNDFINQLSIPYDKVILGGFSQGAMLALDLFLYREDIPRGLILFSGTIFNENHWEILLKRKREFSFFQSHGVHDPILPYSAASRLNDFLNKEMKSELISFEGGHEIPNMVLNETKYYLSKLLN
jgi:phospholipase/carboxylesterase